MCNPDVLGDEYPLFVERVKPDIVTLHQHGFQGIVYKFLACLNLIIQLLKSSDNVKIGKRISMLIKICKP